MKPSISVISAAAALLTLGVLSYAQTQDTSSQTPTHAGMHRTRRAAPGDAAAMRGDRQKRRTEFKAELGLTEAQTADLKKVREATRRDRRSKATELKTARKDLDTLLGAEAVDQNAVNAKLAEIQAAQGGMMKSHVDSVLAMKGILTPEQQTKIREMREARKDRVSARRHDRRQRFQKRLHERADGQAR